MRRFYSLLVVCWMVGAAWAAEEPAKPDTGAAAPTAASDAWKVYTSKEGRFEVRFPVVPKAESRTGMSGARVEFLSAHVPGLAYSVNYTDFPEDGVRIPAGNLMDTVRDGLVRRSKGKLLEDRYVELKPYQGRQLRIEEADKSTTLVRLYVVKNRLYQLRVLALASPVPEGITRFFDSFKLAQP